MRPPPTSTPPADIDLIDLLPLLTSRLHELPQPIQAELFTALDIQVLWNAPMRQATFFATITDTIPGVIDALLARGGNDPATTMPTPPATTLTSNNSGARFTRPPICRKVFLNKESAELRGHTSPV